MSDIFGCLGDELGGVEEALTLASAHQAGTSAGPAASYGRTGAHAAHPLLKRSRLYYQQRKEGAIVGLDNQSATQTRTQRGTADSHITTCRLTHACSFVPAC
jgi:hypothetical protein